MLDIYGIIKHIEIQLGIAIQERLINFNKIYFTFQINTIRLIGQGSYHDLAIIRSVYSRLN